jgi:hypothetical protein
MPAYRLLISSRNLNHKKLLDTQFRGLQFLPFPRTLHSFFFAILQAFRSGAGDHFSDAPPSLSIIENIISGMSHEKVVWDVERFEHQLAKQIRNHTLVSRSPLLLHADSPTTVFDQILLIGVPPYNHPDSAPQILVAYPPVTADGLDFSKLTRLALPTGPSRKYLRAAGSNLIQDDFVFTLSQGVETRYGICIHVKPKTACFFAPTQMRNVVFALCIFVRQPVFSPHFLFLSFLALSSVGSSGLCRLLPPDSEPIDFEGKPIDGMIVTDAIAHNPTIKVPQFFPDAVKSFQLCENGSPPLFLGPDLEIYFPNAEDPNAVLNYTLDTLFSILSVEDIIRLVIAMILDGQILVIGSSLREVTYTVLALQYLIRPFTFCGPVIPILPATAEFLDLLASPTPFLVGVAPCPELRDVVFLDSSIFVHIDRHLVSASSAPVYPNYRPVMEQIERILRQEKSASPHPFGYPMLFRRQTKQKYCFSTITVELIDAAIKHPLSQVCSDFVYCFFVTDVSAAPGGVTVFNSELFLAQVSDDDRPFFAELLDSQTFEMYIETRISEFLAMKGLGGKIAGISSSGSLRGESRRRTRSIDRVMLETF